jgi:BNR repeat-like domain
MSKFGAMGAGLAAGVVLAFAMPAAASVTAPTVVSTSSPFAIGCAGPGHDATGTLSENGEVEPWASVNRHDTSQIAGAWQQDRWSDGGSHGLVSSVSTDGGSTFGTGDVFPDFSRCPLFAHYANPDAQEPGKEFDRGSDPWVSWGDNGRLYQIALTVSQPEFGLGANSGILVSYSDDQGATWTHPTVLKQDAARGGTVLNDKESITADPNSGHVYAIWDRLVSPSSHSTLRSVENAIGYRGPAWFSSSSDRGQTWSPARVIYDPGEVNQTIANQIAVAGDGTLIDVFVLIRNFSNQHGQRGFSVAIMRSGDHGLTWSKPTIVSNLVRATVRTQDGQPLRTGDIIPDIAVDPTSSNVYVSWQDARSGKPAIYVAKSTDNGQTWGPPVKASDSPSGVSAFTGSVDVNDSGTVGVTYYDLRNDTDTNTDGSPNTSTALTDYWFTSSTDGINWSASQRVTPTSFNMKDAPIARGYFVGDYEGLDHAGNDFRLFFVQAQPTPGNPTDVYTATATP